MGCCQCSRDDDRILPFPRNHHQSHEPNTSAILKIAVFGAASVGKSAITVRYVANEFQEYYDSTIEELYTLQTDIDGENTIFEILDVPCSYHHQGLQFHWIRESQNFIVVYNIASERSFKYTKDIFRWIWRNKEDESFNMILVGNKCDLYQECDRIQMQLGLTKENIKDLVYGYINEAEQQFLDNIDSNCQYIPEEIRRVCLKFHGEILDNNVEVSYEMGQQLAKSWENEYFKVPFFETSAKTGENVKQAFESLLMLAKDAKSDSELMELFNTD